MAILVYVRELEHRETGMQCWKVLKMIMIIKIANFDDNRN